MENTIRARLRQLAAVAVGYPYGDIFVGDKYRAHILNTTPGGRYTRFESTVSSTIQIQEVASAKTTRPSVTTRLQASDHTGRDGAVEPPGTDDAAMAGAVPRLAPQGRDDTGRSGR